MVKQGGNLSPPLLHYQNTHGKAGLGLTIDMKQEGWDCMVAVDIVGGVLFHLFEV